MKLPTILVIDPDEKSYNTIESVLGIQNRVLFVPNGLTALELPQTQDFKIIFISQILNGSDGIRLLESFKKQYPSIPIVLFVDNPTADAILSAFRSGAREVIKKPIDEKELFEITQKIIRLVDDDKTKGKEYRVKKKENRYPEAHFYKRNGGGFFRKIFKKFHSNSVKGANDLRGSHDSQNILVEQNVEQKLFSDITLEEIEKNKQIPIHVQEIYSLNRLCKAFFFGNFKFYLKDQVIDEWSSKKGKSIFAYLVLHHGKKIFRDVLMDLFWQKSSPESARNCLNVAIHGIRRVLQDIDPTNEYILYKDECYYLNPEIDVWLDVEEFRKIWRNAQSIEHAKDFSFAVSEYERAADIYRGEFLEDEIYDAWSSLDRENLKEIYLVILDKISDFYVLNKNHFEAIGLCEKILEKDNCREDIYRRLMVCYYRIGQRNKALKLYYKCAEVLQDELEVKPTALTIQLYRKIKENQL